MAMQAVAARPLHSQFNCHHDSKLGLHRDFKFLGTLRGTRRTQKRLVISATVSSGNEMSTKSTSSSGRSEITKTDVVVIGAGIGGLCCAALLANYGYKVVVCESHDIAGGAGHAFERRGFQFDSGPSFHAGLSIKPSINPLKQVCPFCSLN